MQLPDEPFDEAHDADELLSIFTYSYCSRAAPGVDAAEVDRIVAKARHHNALLGITGVLAYGAGVFFQIIEGPRDSITGLVQRLAADPRHDTIIALEESEEVRERLFANWDMELVGATEVREVLVNALADAREGSNAAALQRLIDMLDRGEFQL